MNIYRHLAVAPVTPRTIDTVAEYAVASFVNHQAPPPSPAQVRACAEGARRALLHAYSREGKCQELKRRRQGNRKGAGLASASHLGVLPLAGLLQAQEWDAAGTGGPTGTLRLDAGESRGPACPRVGPDEPRPQEPEAGDPQRQEPQVSQPSPQSLRAQASVPNLCLCLTVIPGLQFSSYMQHTARKEMLRAQANAAAIRIQKVYR